MSGFCWRRTTASHDMGRGVPAEFAWISAGYGNRPDIWAKKEGSSWLCQFAYGEKGLKRLGPTRDLAATRLMNEFTRLEKVSHLQT